MPTVRVVEPPQTLADEHTLIAQRYAGYFVGHPYRAAQQRVGPGAIEVERAKEWREPAVTADSCVFCARLTDEDATRRVAGYQHAIDIEVLRPHSLAYAQWLGSGGTEVTPEVTFPAAEGTKQRAVSASQANRRRFIETHMDQLNIRPLPLIHLPLRLKRKLCIEWNHVYTRWLEENADIEYDPASREFHREAGAEELEHPPQTRTDWWFGVVPRAAAGGVR